MPPPAKRGIMRNEFRQPDEQNMRQLLHQHPEDLPGLILRLAWLQGLSREEIVALKWAQVDFQERSLFLEDRTVPLEEETAGCLAARFRAICKRLAFRLENACPSASKMAARCLLMW